MALSFMEQEFEKWKARRGLPSSPPGSPDPGDLDAPLWPVASTNTSRGNQFSSNHPARDIASARGDPIVSSVTGTVVSPIIKDPDYGLNVSVRADSGPFKGYTFHYSHLSGTASKIRVGSKIGIGDYIGMVGSTGKSTGPHLDFEVYNPSGTRIDPLTVDWGNFQAPGNIPSLSGHHLEGNRPSAPKSGKRFSGSRVPGATPTEDDETIQLGNQIRASIGLPPIPGSQAAAEFKEVPGDITLLNTPIGPIKLLGLGSRFKRTVAFSVAALVFLIAFGALVGRSRAGGKVRKVGKVAAGEGLNLIPGVGEAASVTRIVKAAS